MSMSKATRKSGPCGWRWRSWSSSPREVKILGVYPANPFRLEQQNQAIGDD